MEKPKLDFSEFHPLDHHIWEKTCRELPKANFRTTWGYHLHNAWSYKWRIDIRYRVYKHFLCKLGKHKMQKMWWPKQKKVFMACVGCDNKEELPWDENDDPMKKFRLDDD